MKHGERLPIVLCCAEETEVALVAVVDALLQQGWAPEVLPGVERDADLLGTAADRIRGPALFVLCQSEDLDRFQIRRLQGLFSARKSPEHRMITVDVQAMGPMAILPEVRVATEGGGRPAAPDDDDDGRHMRDVVVPNVMAAPGASIPERSRQRAPVAQEPQGISEEALGLTPEIPAPVEPPRKLYPEPDVLIATDPTGETVTPFSGMRYQPRAGDGVPRPAPEAPSEEGAPDVEVVDVSSHRVAWGDHHSGPIEVDRVSKRASDADPRAEADAAPLPSVSSPIQVDDGEAAPPESERRAGRIGLLLLAGVGMAGVVAMAVLHGTAPVGVGPVEQATERGVPVVRGQVAGGVGAQDDAASSADAGSPAGAEAGAGSGGPALAGGSGEGPAGADPTGAGAPAAADAGGGTGGAAGASDASGGPGNEAGDDTGDDVDAESGGAGDGASSGSKSVPPPPGVDPSASQLDAQLDAALADGRLEAAGDLLVSRSGSGTMTWDEASTRCRRHKAEGLRRWRLPTKGQLAKLRKAKLLASGSYWSRSEVGGDEVYALDAASGRLNVWLKVEPNARALCVRKRP